MTPPRIRLFPAWAAALSLLAPASARAAQISTVTGEEIAGEVDSVGVEAGVKISTSSGSRDVAAADVHSIVFQAPAASPPRDRSRVWFVGGSEILGTIVDGEANHLSLSDPFVSKTAFLLDTVRGVVFPPPADAPSGREDFEKALSEPHAEDVLFVIKDRKIARVPVVVEGITSKDVKVYIPGTQERRTLERSKVYGVILRGTAPEGEPAVQVDLASEGRLVAESVEVKTGRLSLTTVEGIKAEFPLEKVAALRFLKSRLAFLSDLKPEKVEETPLFPPAKGPDGSEVRDPLVTWDKGYNGKPITLRGKAYAKGIGAHSKSILTFRLDQKYEKFAADAGIDDDAVGPPPVNARGNATFRVKGDDKILFEAQNVTGNDPAKPIDLDVTGVTLLVLEVDYGTPALSDTLDRGVWANARVLRKQSVKPENGEK